MMKSIELKQFANGSPVNLERVLCTSNGKQKTSFQEKNKKK